MKQNEHDITELLFPLEEQTPEDKRKLELWRIASNEADRLVGRASPVLLHKKANELYRQYLAKENLVYDEGRGF